MTQPQIRKATSKDVKAILALIEELAVYEKEPDAVEITEEDLLRDGFSGHPKFEVFVALVEGEIIGMALFYYRYSTWKGKTLHLEDLIVKVAYRANGVGTMLYNEVLKYAHQQKLKRVEWVVLDWNTPAVNFYKNSGATIFEDWRTVQMDAEQLKAYIERVG